MITILSLGAGVQSTTLALMAAAGEITPMPTGAIFADTQAEPASVYRHLDWLESKLSFPIHRVTAGNLGQHIMDGMAGKNRIAGRPPFFAGGGLLNRQCTRHYKLDPIMRKTRELAGLAKGQRGGKVPIVEQWIGISADEAMRAKPSRLPYIVHRFPLLETRTTRRDCLNWLDRNGHPQPAKSACTFCPYHNDALWRDMKANDPESFADAVRIDEAIRPGLPGQNRPEGERGQWFVHRSRLPLADVDFSTAEDRGQLNLFNNECEGMCGV